MTEKTFTQEEVNQIVRERLAQEKEKAAAALKEREAEWKAQAEKDTEAVRRELESLKAEKQNRTVMDILEKAKAADPAEMAKLLAPRIKTSENGEITLDGEDGKPVPIEKGVKQFMEAHPWAKKTIEIRGGYKPMGGVVAAPDASLRTAFDL